MIVVIIVGQFESVVHTMASYSVLGVAFCISLGVTRGFTDDILSIPKDLLLGTASAAYQIEGAWNEGGT